MLEISSLTKRFGGIPALDNCSLRVETGSLVGLIGPNGSGKTTLLNLISGLYKPDAGEVLFGGAVLTNKPTYQIARMGVGRLFQTPSLFARLTVAENLQVAFSAPRNRRDLDGSRRADGMGRFVAVLERVGLDPALLPRIAGNLSGGQQRLLELARLLLTGPRLLLLDEPTAGVHPAVVQRLLQVIVELNQEGRTVILVSHDLPVIMSVCRRLVVLAVGRVIADGDPVVVRKRPEVVDAYLGA